MSGHGTDVGILKCWLPAGGTLVVKLKGYVGIKALCFVVVMALRGD